MLHIEDCPDPKVWEHNGVAGQNLKLCFPGAVGDHQEISHTMRGAPGK